MKRKIYDCFLHTSIYMMLLSIYCKITVSKFYILQKSDMEVLFVFFIGVILSFIMLFLLRYLFRYILKQ